MPRSPSHSDDAPVDSQAGEAQPEAKKPEAGRTRHIVAGAAIGIGSAALVAALLYANRARKSDRT